MEILQDDDVGVDVGGDVNDDVPNLGLDQSAPMDVDLPGREAAPSVSNVDDNVLQTMKEAVV